MITHHGEDGYRNPRGTLAEPSRPDFAVKIVPL